MIEISSLVGDHVLTGVDDFATKFRFGSYDYDNANCIRFVLDGITYTAVEDPEDGYRSCLGSLFVTNDRVKNVFEPCYVTCEWKDRNPGRDVDCDTLVMTDKRTGLIVLEIGTDNTDDYYPSFVGYFKPENMYVNRDNRNEDMP